MLKLYENVLEPNDETEFFIKNMKIKKGSVVLELGIGSGLISLVAAKRARKVYGCDINPFAARASRLNAEINFINNVEFIEGDLFLPYSEMRFDTILSIPPYIPTNPSVRKVETYQSIASDGSDNGRGVIEKIISNFSEHLVQEGSMQILHSSLADTDVTKNKLKLDGFEIDVLAERTQSLGRIGSERIEYLQRLGVVKVDRPTETQTILKITKK